MTDRLWLSGWSIPATIWRESVQSFPAGKQRTIDFNQGGDSPLVSAEQALYLLQPPVTVIGWSMGAMVALELALRHPQWIDRLILIAVTDQFVRDQNREHGWDLRVLRRMKKQLHLHPAETIASFDQRLFSPDSPDDPWRRQIRGSRAHALAGLVAGLEYLEQFRFPPHLASEITQPVYLLHGENDAICHPESGRRLALTLPQAEWTLWKDTGHIPFWTRQEAFKHWLEGRLRR
ncbi:alpha/beta fold hydrolase [Desmospora profundinema]|uniref:Pimeloyl-[acyl-carrier protein] methyl ester esterase n=1 Tax=Desmospora profundinema TaxID=1571184 RepID=A0ABU1IJ20_9BACL|nr:alpha/beta fold hydrolase [Desmospora profundinema]MDR6224776.1 pimeloyl-[acyl-carrier protein] methyl ester esterase [Desmospora profundinema]